MPVLMLALATVIAAAPDPGEPAPALPLPKDLEEVGEAPWTPLVLDDCKARLEAAGYSGREFKFSSWNYIKTKKQRGMDPIHCHVPQPVVMYRSSAGMSYYGYTFVNCAMAVAMTRFERIAQEEARRIWERPDDQNPVRAMSHMGTYNCRTLRYKTKQSQHSFGNGLDIAVFRIQGAGEVSVAKHWTARWPALQKKADFLRALSRRLREEAIFTNVLDPDSDPGHWNHIHVDLAPLSDGEPSPALARMKAPVGGKWDDPGREDRELVRTEPTKADARP